MDLASAAALAGGLGDFIGGVAGISSARRAQRQSQYNYENAIQIRVRDAQKAGIHPLAALGMPAQAPQNLQIPGRRGGVAANALSNTFNELSVAKLAAETRKTDAEARSKEQEIRVKDQQMRLAESLERIRKMRDDAGVAWAHFWRQKERDQMEADPFRSRPLWQNYKDQYTGQVYTLPSEEVAESGEGFLGSSLSIAKAIEMLLSGQGRTDGRPMFRITPPGER